MSDKNWTLTANMRPPKDVLVDTISTRGTVQELRFHDSHWWAPDNSIYVYYEPLFWREKETQ